MFQTKVVEKIETHILYSITFFENRALYEIMWKNIVKSNRPQMKIRCMRIACSIPTATDTHSEYVIFIAFPLQQWLHECGSMLRCTYITCHVLSVSPACCTVSSMHYPYGNFSLGFPFTKTFMMISCSINQFKFVPSLNLFFFFRFAILGLQKR